MRKIVAVIIFFLLIAFSSLALAYSGSDYTSNPDLAEKLTKLFNGEVSIFKDGTKYKVGDEFSESLKYWDSDNGAQCYAYANAAYYYLFGDSPKHGDSSSYSRSIKVSGVKGKNNLSAKIFEDRGIGCGAWIRTTVYSDGSYHSGEGGKAHSMIVLSYDSTYIVYLHASRLNNVYRVQITKEKWEDFNKRQLSGRSRFICAILQPKLTAGVANPISLSEYPIIENATAPTTLSNNQSYTLKGDISCKYTITELRGVLYKCNSDGTKTVMSEKTVNPNNNYYSMGGDVIDTSLKFGDSRLNNSWCLYELTAKYNKNGTTWTKRLFYRYVKIGSPAGVSFVTPGVYQFTLDDETRSGPAEANSIVRSCPKGTIVFVTGCELNSSNNGWFKLSDGSYVFGGDVEPITWNESELLGTYYYRWAVAAEQYPFKDSPDYRSYNKDDAVTVVAQLWNAYNELWYKLSDGSYVYSGDVCAHSYSWIRVKEPTATEDGEDQYKCSICGDVKETASVQKLTASGVCGDNATWEYNNGTLTISGTGSIYNYEQLKSPWESFRSSIRELVVEEGITSLGVYAFYYTYNLTSVSLPSSLKTIGDGAFEACSSIYWIAFPENLETIGGWAFYKCSNLPFIDIPESLHTIGDGAFRECTDLSYVFLPNNVSYVGNSAFRGCTNLSWARLSYGMSTIQYDCFDGCTSLTEIEIPYSITNIGYRAFEDCNALTKVWILPSNVAIDVKTTEAEDTNTAFTRCNNATIYCAEGSTAYSYAQQHGIPAVIISGLCGNNMDWTYGSDGTLWIGGTGALADYNSSSEAPWSHLAWSIKTIEVLNGITSIGKNALAYTSASRIILPEGLISINESGLEGNYNLSEISLPANLESIGDYAFRYCPFSSITIPASVTSIGHSVFLYCKNLQMINVSSSNRVYCSVDGVLYTKNMNMICDYPEAKAGAYTIPSGVTQINWGAFEDCDNVTAVVIPDSVWSIGQYAFVNCDSLTELTIPASVYCIIDATINNCLNLYDVYISANTTVDDYWDGVTFRDCPNIVIHAPYESSAIKYALKHGIDYVITSYPVQSISFVPTIESQPGIIYIEKGDTANLDIIVTPENASNQDIVFPIIDDGIIRVNGDNAIEAIDYGWSKFDISSAENPSITCRVDVFVYGVNDIRIRNLNQNGIDGTIEMDLYTSGQARFNGFSIYCGDPGLTIKSIQLSSKYSRYCNIAGESGDGFWLVEPGESSKESFYFNNNEIIAHIELQQEGVDTLWGHHIEYGDIGLWLRDIHTYEDVSFSAPVGEFWNEPIRVNFNAKVLNSPDLLIPTAMKKIEEEAFANTPVVTVKLPEGTEEIGANAFANCLNLKQIYIPKGCERISTTAFSGINNLTIFGIEGSYAEWYASRRGFKFISTQGVQ